VRIFFGIDKGLLDVSDLSQNMLLGRFRPDQGDELTKLLAGLIRRGWDGMASGSSSMNWATENGWPTEDPSDGFVRPAVRRAAAIVREERTKDRPAPPRAESGPIQFGDDWPGVFLRGDYAGPVAMTLDRVLDGIDASTMDAAQLRGLARLLAASDVRSGTDKRVLRPYQECLPGHRLIDEDG